MLVMWSCSRIKLVHMVRWLEFNESICMRNSFIVDIEFISSYSTLYRRKICGTSHWVCVWAMGGMSSHSDSDQYIYVAHIECVFISSDKSILLIDFVPFRELRVCRRCRITFSTSCAASFQIGWPQFAIQCNMFSCSSNSKNGSIEV